MDSSSRTSNSVKNILSILIIQITAVVYSLVIKRMLLQTFSIDLIGVGNLFDTFINSFNIMDAGFSSLLSFYLYKSLSENDTELTRKYLSMFKTVYWTIAAIVVLVLLIIAPFIYNIFNINYDNASVVYAYYFMHMGMAAIRFMLLNKITLLSAMQKKYLNNYFAIVFEFVMFCARMYAITTIKSFVLYSFLTVAVTIVEYFNAYRLSSKKYPVYRKIPFASYSEIREFGMLNKVKRYIYRTVYDLVYYSTDTTIIGILDSTASIGYLSNYTMIISTVNSVFGSLIASIQSSLGNMLFKEKNINNYYFTYETINLFGFYLATLIAAGMLLVIDDAVTLIFGSQYIIDSHITFVLIFTLYINNTMRNTENIFSVSGLMFKEKWPLIISALLNVILSLGLYYSIGLIGIYIATFITTLVYWYGKIYHVSRSVFSQQRSDYFKGLVINYGKSIIVLSASYWLLTIISFPVVGFVTLIEYILMITAAVTVLFSLLNINNKYFKYAVNYLWNFIKNK